MRVKTLQKKQQKTWIVSKPMDDVIQMRFGANGQRTTTIDWCGRLGITESWYRGIPTESGQLDYPRMEERRLYASEKILIESNGDRLHGLFQFLFG